MEWFKQVRYGLIAGVSFVLSNHTNDRCKKAPVLIIRDRTVDIQLNFINNSNDTNNSQIVIFQKNVATNFNELAVAWKVIRHTGLGDNHPFTFPLHYSVGASDSYGHFTPQLPAQSGQMFHFAMSPSSDTLSYAGPATVNREIQIRNDHTKDAIYAAIYKSGKLLARSTSVAPGKKAMFEFGPTIWIGVVSQLVEGDLINSAIISDVNTELSLLGIASADIVMTGGGPRASSQPFSFTLQNIVMA